MARKIEIENVNPRQIPSPCGRGLRGGVTKLVIKHPHPNPPPSRGRELFTMSISISGFNDLLYVVFDKIKEEKFAERPTVIGYTEFVNTNITVAERLWIQRGFELTKD